jgi:hypothetical protein
MDSKPDKPRRTLTQGFGTETPFPVGRDKGPSSWGNLRDAQNEGVPTGLPWNLFEPENVGPASAAIASQAHESQDHAAHGHENQSPQPDSVRLHFALAGLLIGLFLGWIGATVL